MASLLTCHSKYDFVVFQTFLTLRDGVLRTMDSPMQWTWSGSLSKSLVTTSPSVWQVCVRGCVCGRCVCVAMCVLN